MSRNGGRRVKTGDPGVTTLNGLCFKCTLNAEAIVPFLDPVDYQQLSQQGDPPADAVVQALHAQGRQSGDMLTRVKALAATEGGVYQAFLDQAERVPAWVCLKDMEAGQALFLRCAPLSIAVFVLGTLLTTYAPPGSARVLIHTGRLRADVLRRLYETATMVHAIMTPGGLEVGSTGHQAILRVRLLHAMVRQHVLARPGWPGEQLGAPINQLQMGQTALGFSFLLLQGLERLGVKASERERRGFQHLWRYANYLQGVDLRLLPATLADEAELWADHQAHLMHPDENSRTLTAAVHDGLAWQAPFYLSAPVLQAVTRCLLPTSLCDQLAVPRHPVWQAFISMMAGLHRLLSVRYLVPGWRALEVRAGRRYFSRLIDRGLAGQAADYALKTTREGHG